MRILQLTSDWKWTGPAEPMLLLAAALREAGDTLWLGCPEAPLGADPGVAARARDRGQGPELQIEQGRGIRPLRDAPAARALESFIDAHDVDVIHTWHSRDHALALRAARVRRRSGATVVVRSHSSADAISGLPWNRWLFGAGTDALLCVSPGAADRNREIRGGRPIAGALGCVDLARFEAAPEASCELRSQLGLADGPVIGVVARVQRHRRFDLLLGAMQRLARVHPDAQLLVLGRGTHLDELARRPAEALGIADRVVFAGYRDADYPQALRALDCLTFLVPGSDGTCRAVLEAAACGVPSVASRRGALPEIVRHEQSGLLVEESPEALALSWSRLLSDEMERRRLGEGARERAREQFAPARRAACVRELYREAFAARGAR